METSDKPEDISAHDLDMAVGGGQIKGETHDHIEDAHADIAVAKGEQRRKAIVIDRKV